jgi:RNA polymerase sigma-70 factor (ECF subfamily)
MSSQSNVDAAPSAAEVALVSGSDSAPVCEIGDDAALMLRYRKGDMRAFEVLYARHKTPLYRYLSRTLRNKEAANDVFQEVWGKVIASRERYEARASFATFLYRIAHNCAMDYFRRAARAEEDRAQDVDELADSLPSVDVPRPDAALATAQLRAALRRALDELPAEQRDVFVLYEETGLSLDEIGKITGVAMETAKSRLRYAVAKLRAALAPHHPASVPS